MMCRTSLATLMYQMKLWRAWIKFSVKTLG